LSSTRRKRATTNTLPGTSASQFENSRLGALGQRTLPCFGKRVVFGRSRHFFS
jgi:hypothetical protein